MSFKTAVVAQFHRPSGWLGGLAGWIMAHRPSNRRRNRWAVELMAPAPGARMVELGCGPGLALEGALARGAGFALGLDHSEVMLAQARRRCAGALAARRLELRLGGVETLRPDDPPFDAAVLVNVAQFLPDRPAAFAALAAALRPGGRLVAVYQPRLERDTEAAAAKMEAKIAADVAAAGFTDVETRRLPGESPPVVGVTGVRTADRSS